jgi:methionine-rich copper-binding protein CopC
MKRILLLTFATLLFSSLTVLAQDRVQHPVSSARIVGVDGKTELLFDEAIHDSFTVSVLDLTGKSMFMLKHNANDEACESVPLPVENLRKGIYMVQVIGADGKTKTLKLQRN